MIQLRNESRSIDELACCFLGLQWSDRVGEKEWGACRQDKPSLHLCRCPAPRAAGSWFPGGGARFSGLLPPAPQVMHLHLTPGMELLGFSFTVFILPCIWVLLFIIQLLVFIYVLFIRNYTSVRVFLSWGVLFFSIRDRCIGSINESSWGRVSLEYLLATVDK